MAFQRLYLIADLNTFLKKLDDRHEAKIKKQGMLMARKTRSVGSPSSSVPSPDTASRTIERKVSYIYTTKVLCYFLLPFCADGDTHIETSWNILILNFFLSHLTYTHERDHLISEILIWSGTSWARSFQVSYTELNTTNLCTEIISKGFQHWPFELSNLVYILDSWESKVVQVVH